MLSNIFLAMIIRPFLIEKNVVISLTETIFSALGFQEGNALWWISVLVQLSVEAQQDQVTNCF